jgi:Ras family
MILNSSKRYPTQSSLTSNFLTKTSYINLLSLEIQVSLIHSISIITNLYLGVGKSCLLARIMDNDFKIEHQVTIGVEFGAFIVNIQEKIVKL